MDEKGPIKTVLELDLASYSDVARALEEQLNVQAVKAFEDQIQAFVDQALQRVGLRVVFGTAGDNALLFFDDADLMHQFAEAVHESTVEYNRTKSVPSAKRWFRMGAATGPVLLIPEQRRIVGTTVARAVRLEAAAERGHLLIDAASFTSLPQHIQKLYRDQEIALGKRDEQFAAYRCIFPNAPEVSSPSITSQPDAGPASKTSALQKALLTACVITAVALAATAAIFTMLGIPMSSTPLKVLVAIGLPVCFIIIFRVVLRSVKELMVLLTAIIALGVVGVGLFGKQVKSAFTRNTGALGGQTVDDAVVSAGKTGVVTNKSDAMGTFDKPPSRKNESSNTSTNGAQAPTRGYPQTK